MFSSAARYTHILGQPLHLLILSPVPALLPGTLISLVSHCTFSYSLLYLHCCQVHSYPWSATAPSHTLSCTCTAARYTHFLGQPLHILILSPVPTLLPGTLISLVSHCTFSYSLLYLHCCQVHSYPWSATAPSHTLSCTCTAARSTHILGQPLHLFILSPVPALLPGTLISLAFDQVHGLLVLGQPMHLFIFGTHNPDVLRDIFLSPESQQNLCLSALQPNDTRYTQSAELCSQALARIEIKTISQCVQLNLDWILPPPPPPPPPFQKLRYVHPRSSADMA